MKVLLQGRAVAGARRGGDSTLAGRLADELRALGHDVEVAAAPPADGVRGFDIVHGINVDRSVLPETEAFAAAAQRASVPFVLMPLWWPLDEFRAGMAPMARAAFVLRGSPPARLLRERRLGALRPVGGRQAAVLAAASVVCPSGASEEDALVDAFGPLPTTCVHYGTDLRPSPDEVPRRGVLCVARLDPRKNQLALIEALAGTGLPLRLVGTDTVFPRYAAACRAAAGPDVSFEGFLPPEEVERAYRTAAVHALPSWFELPGLVSLDAAAAGAAVVVGSAGTATDYFGDRARYCEPSPGSIRSAVLAAVADGPPPGLAEHVATRYRWRSTAEELEAAYDRRT